jgi:hypothetical protein
MLTTESPGTKLRGRPSVRGNGPCSNGFGPTRRGGTELAGHPAAGSSVPPERKCPIKRIALVFAALTIAACTAWAVVPPGHAPQGLPRAAAHPDLRPASLAAVAALPAVINSSRGPVANRPAARAQFPAGAASAAREPVMMMLASLGLIALGVAVRRRRY